MSIVQRSNVCVDMVTAVARLLIIVWLHRGLNRAARIAGPSIEAYTGNIVTTTYHNLQYFSNVVVQEQMVLLILEIIIMSVIC